MGNRGGKDLRIYAGPSRYSIVKVILSYCVAYSSFETKYRMQRQCVNTKVHINFFSYKTKYMLSWNINFEVTFREMRWVCALFMAFRASALFMVFLCQTSFPSFLLRMGCWPGKDKSEYFVLWKYTYAQQNNSTKGGEVKGGRKLAEHESESELSEGSTE